MPVGPFAAGSQCGSEHAGHPIDATTIADSADGVGKFKMIKNTKKIYLNYFLLNFCLHSTLIGHFIIKYQPTFTQITHFHVHSHQYSTFAAFDGQ